MQEILDYLGDVGNDINKKCLSDKIKRVYEDHCCVCLGKGHVPKDCGTKKDLDVHFKLLRYGPEWGLIKSRIMSANMSRFRRELRKRTTEEFENGSFGLSGNAGNSNRENNSRSGVRRTGPTEARQT